MGKIKEIDIDKKNYISQNFGELIADLSDKIVKDLQLTSTHNKNEIQNIYNQWYEYIESKFYEFIEVPKHIYYCGIDPYNVEPIISDNEYILIQWPESQSLMENDWFQEEAILDIEGKFGSSAYFIPKKRIINLTK